MFLPSSSVLIWVAVAAIGVCGVMFLLKAVGVDSRRIWIIPLAVAIAAGFVYLQSEMLQPITQSPAMRAKSEIRNMATSLETYRIDNEVYPPACDNYGRVVPYNKEGVSAGYLPLLLTTPVIYSETLPLDQFNKTKPGWAGTSKRLYRYATNGKGCWIMASVCYHGKEVMRIEEFCDPNKADCDPTKFFSHLGPGSAVVYDDTNGTESAGEIVKYGP
jgi:hypothetical protein